MPKAKPISLHPLSFEEAIAGLAKVDPNKVGLLKKKQKTKRAK